MTNQTTDQAPTSAPKYTSSITILRSGKGMGKHIAAHVNGLWRTVMSADAACYDFDVTPCGEANIKTYASDAALPDQLEVIHGDQHWLCRKMIGHRDTYIRVGVMLCPSICILRIKS